ncbi:MAG TPA: hypothetical protein VGH59_13370 [Casimicrobiaceae bacterium]
MDDHLDTDVTRASPNKDPITGAPGAHPVGVGVGAATGGIAAGAAAGTLAAGPLGTAIGAAVGAVVGGLAGKAVAEHYDPTIEEQYWRGAYADEPYYQRGKTFDDYAPAYRLGGEAYGRHGGTSFENFEDELADEYRRSHGTSRLSWDEARPATYAAWHRLRGDVV